MTTEIEKPRAFAIVKNALFEAYEAVHGKDELKGTTSNNIDVTTRGDAAAGEAMVAYLKDVEPIGVVYTEEQGKVVLNKDGRYSVILDDIDDTKNFKEGFGMLPHGSTVGVFEGRDPRFCDCLASGYLDYPSGNFFYAIKGKGCFVREGLKKGTNIDIKQLHTSGREQLFIEGKNLTMLPDIYMLGDLAPEFMKYSAKAWLGDFRCTAVQLALIAAGSADVFIAGDNAFNPNKHRTGEEIGPGYLLVKEAGGAMTDWNGRDIGKEKVGMTEKKTWHYIVAASRELAMELSINMRNNPVIGYYMHQKKILD